MVSKSVALISKIATEPLSRFVQTFVFELWKKINKIQGTNVEFGPTVFAAGANGGASAAEPIDAEFNGATGGKTRDFSNPMYDALGGAVGADTETASVTSSKGGIYEVPADMIKGTRSHRNDRFFLTSFFSVDPFLKSRHALITTRSTYLAFELN